MITFADGPAFGITLVLDRAPLFLRVTQNGITFRGLANESDEPEPTEIIYVYLRVPGTRCKTATDQGIRLTACYQYFQPQPKEKLIFHNHSWRGWANRTALELNLIKQPATP